MIERQHQNQFFLLSDERYSELDYTQFFQPDYWQKQGRVSGTAKGRGTTYFLQTDDLFGVNASLRHYYRGGLWGKIIRDRYRFTVLSQTRSFAELRLLQKLYLAGLPVPKPIMAVVEKGKLGICYRADILMEKIENAQDLTALLQHQTLPSEIWQQIGGLIRQLHDLQICHTDLNAHNILLQQTATGQKCWLLDFDKCGEKSGDFWKQGNLERLQRSFHKEIERMKIQFSTQNWQDLLTGYHNRQI
ncbi:3-deoxy-D-manno-octulosonic acid kinase [Lonepinella koalarum]|uniref:3-deoxy-D-manno-octulosonic acid kinase n=1 Tax=Lonepinella koalarum TaxID=53417 RepID=UPI0011E404EA|nr:3-deoxy-D-manno-octulosonic acid kinase [Lonepinella koalarum]TYG34373.1 3-deoxy-D-manno-octulosonic acid kinase [Lonepinella koalarum]